MITSRKTQSPVGLLAVAAAASLVVSAVPFAVRAQPYAGGYDQGDPPGYDQGYDYGPAPGYVHETDGVTVYAPRYVGRSATTGAPIEVVRASRVVNYSDIDPYTDWGAHVLRTRIERAARSACDQLDQEYPISTADNPPCVDQAVRNAMVQVRENEEGW